MTTRLYFHPALLQFTELHMNRLLVRCALFVIPLFACVFVLVAADTSSLLTPPVAKKVPKVTEIHGIRLVDSYFWLRNKSNPDVREYLEAENPYTDGVI